MPLPSSIASRSQQYAAQTTGPRPRTVHGLQSAQIMSGCGPPLPQNAHLALATRIPLLTPRIMPPGTDDLSLFADNLS